MTHAQRIISELYLTGRHIKEIAEAAGVTPGSARVIASRLGLKRGQPGKGPPQPKPRQFRKATFSGKDKHERQWGGY